LGVAKVVVRWRVPDYEDIIRVRAACRWMGCGVALVEAVEQGYGERRWDVMWSWHSTGRPGPDRQKVWMLRAAMPPWCAIPKVARLLLVCAFCQLKVIVW